MRNISYLGAQYNIFAHFPSLYRIWHTRVIKAPETSWHSFSVTLRVHVTLSLSMLQPMSVSVPLSVSLPVFVPTDDDVDYRPRTTLTSRHFSLISVTITCHRRHVGSWRCRLRHRTRHQSSVDDRRGGRTLIRQTSPEMYMYTGVYDKKTVVTFSKQTANYYNLLKAPCLL